MSPHLQRHTYYEGMWIPHRRSGGGVIVLPPENVPPGVVGNLAVSNVTTTAFGLTWTPATDPDGSISSYRVLVNGTPAGSTSSNNFVVGGLTAGTTYTVAVQAVDDDGAFGAASIISVTTLATMPSITHGKDINQFNTGPFAYFDNTLGRYLTESDLTTHNSRRSLSDFVSPGGTIRNQVFRAGCNMNLTNVTVQNCIFNDAIIILGSNFVNFEFCKVEVLNPNVTGFDPAGFDNAIAYGSYRFHRGQLGGGSDGAKTNGGAEITESLIRTRSQSAGDHNDGIQANASASGNKVKRCNIDVRPVNLTPQQLAEYNGINGALFSADNSLGLQEWEDNLLYGGGYVIRAHEAATYRIQGNWVVAGTYKYSPASFTNALPGAINWAPERPNLVVVDQTWQVVSTIAGP